MFTIYRAALTLHILAGIVGMAAFWTPVVTRKGGTTHRRAGRVFFRATSIVALTGLVMAAALFSDPLAAQPPKQALTAQAAAATIARIRLFVPFLLYLVLITFTPVYHGVRVLATRREPSLLRTPFHTVINVAAIVGSVGMIAIGLMARRPIFVFMSPIGFLVGIGNLRFARHPQVTPMAWWYEHMGAMLGGGIAFHTAFFVLGAGRLFGLQLEGMAAVVPWVLPSLVGIPATVVWRDPIAGGSAILSPNGLPPRDQGEVHAWYRVPRHRWNLDRLSTQPNRAVCANTAAPQSGDREAR